MLCLTAALIILLSVSHYCFYCCYSLYGVQSNGWIVVTVEFRPIFSTVCIASDYYSWTPFDDVMILVNSPVFVTLPSIVLQITDTDCLLGSSVTIERRLASHCCLNGESYIRAISHSVCPCNGDDFEWLGFWSLNVTIF